MQLTVLDANGTAQVVIVKGLETVLDRSGSIGQNNLSQFAFNQNPTRSGYFIMNLGNSDMWINDLGNAAVGLSSFRLPPGGSWPPPDYAVTPNAVSIIGVAQQPYTAREW